MSASWLARRGPGFWIGLMLANMGVIAALAATGAINGPTALVLMALQSVLLVPLMKSSETCEERSGISSPAVRRYNRGMLAASMAYIAGMGIAVWLDNVVEVEQGLMWVVAFLPSLPIIAMIWVMARYIRDEDDEFLRDRAIKASLAGLALLLGVASLWGFLEEFSLVPHAGGWWAVPIWALGMGVSRMWMAAQDRKSEGDAQ